MAVAGGIGDDQGGQVFCGLALVVAGVGYFDFAHALQAGGLLGGGAAGGAGNEDVNVATDFRGCSNGVERGGLEAGVVVVLR